MRRCQTQKLDCLNERQERGNGYAVYVNATTTLTLYVNKLICGNYFSLGHTSMYRRLQNKLLQTSLGKPES